MEALFDSIWAWLILAALVLAGLYLATWRLGGRRSVLPAGERDLALEGVLALAAGRGDQAEALLAAAIENDPADPMPYLVFAVALLQRGEAERAARLLQGVLARRDLPAAFTRRAHEVLVEALARSNQTEAAASWARSLDEQIEEDLELLERRARLAMAARSYDTVAHLNARIERLDRGRARTLEALALAAEAEDLADAGRRDEALKLLKKAHARDAGLGVAWALDGELRLEAGDLGKARSALLEALTEQTRLGLVVFPVLEDAHISRGQVADYEAMLYQLLERRPQDPVTLWALGSHHWRRHHLDEAERVLGEAIEVEPSFWRAHRTLAAVAAERRGESPTLPPHRDPPVTRCEACGCEDVRGIVRCPTCAQVGRIVFRDGEPRARPEDLVEGVSG